MNIKKKLVATSIILSSVMAGSAYAQDSFNAPDPAPQKIAVMDDLIKSVIKESVQAIGTKVMDKIMTKIDSQNNQEGYSQDGYSQETYSGQENNNKNPEFDNQGQLNEPMEPVL